MKTFEEFNDLMKPISDYRKEYDESIKALEILTDDCFVVPKLGVNLLESYIDLLSILMKDEDGNIEYFIYECEYGNKPMTITYKDGTMFLMDSIKTLYNAIVYENVN